MNTWPSIHSLKIEAKQTSKIFFHPGFHEISWKSREERTVCVCGPFITSPPDEFNKMIAVSLVVR